VIFPKLKLPLNVKISIHTMALVALTVVLMGLLHYGKTRREIIDLNKQRLIHIASTAALSLEAEAHAVLGGQQSQKWPAFKKMRSFLLAVKEKNQLEMPIYTLRRVGEDEAEYVVTTHAMSRVGTRRRFTPGMRVAFDRGKDVATDMYPDGDGMWLSAYAPIKNPSGEVEAVLAVDYRADKLMAELTARRRLTILYGLTVLAVALVLSLFLARTVTGPMSRLLEAARALARGDYEHGVQVRSRDEVGELAEGFEAMRHSMKDALEARDRLTGDLTRTVEELEDNLEKLNLMETVKKHLEKFVPGQVLRIIEKAPDAPALHKEEMDASILFIDVVGYTRLSEEVNRDRMDYIIERYFSNFVDPIQANGGDINETTGDGLMIIFHHPEPAENAIRAITAARAIRRLTDAINREEAVIHADEEGDFRPIGIKFGINSGLANVGVTKFEGIGGDRYTFTATGPVTNVASRIVDLASEGEILVGEDTAKRVDVYVSLEEVGSFSLKNVREPVKVFRVSAAPEGDSASDEDLFFPA
jgi:class 3 adenylate cyclase